jgi:hypothetical protein
VTSLSLLDAESGGEGAVVMVTESLLTCDVCVDCGGGFFLGFLDVWTDMIAWNATMWELELALQGLRTLTGVAAVYGPVQINATALGGTSGYAGEGMEEVLGMSSSATDSEAFSHLSEKRS